MSSRSWAALRGMTDATDDASRWTWIAPDGALATGEATELEAKLRSGELSPATFVWRRTWLEWVPAARVPDLAGTLPPGTAEAPRPPRTAPTARTPPARPLTAPKAFAADALPRPPFTRQPNGEARPSSFGTLARPRGPSVLGPPRQAALDPSAPPRAPLPTLGEDPEDLRMATLRPPGAVPPPPRGVPLGAVPRVGRDELQEEQTTKRLGPTLGAHAPAEPERETLPGAVDSEPVADSVPQLARASVAEPPTLPAPPPDSAVADRLAESPVAATAADFDSSVGSAPVQEVPAAALAASPSELRARGREVVTEGTRERPHASDLASAMMSRVSLPKVAVVGFVLLVGVIALLAGGLVALLVSRSHEEARAPRASPPPAVSPAPAAPKVAGCRLLQPASRLASAIHRAVPPLLTEVTQGERVAVGFAETPKQAAGLLVQPRTLDTEVAFQQATEHALYGVLPIVDAGAAKFVADRAEGELNAVRSLGPGLALGISGVDWVRARGGDTQVVWANAAQQKTTDPRVASGAAGHLVTFRRGGLAGRILYGWLRPDGSPAGELVTVSTPSVVQLGTPDAAVQGEQGLIVFAGRSGPDAEWRVHLVEAPLRGPARVHAFERPAGGAGGGSIAPSAARLGARGWLLQWTEGSTGQYQVRLQALGEKLEPVGEPRLVSSKGANAGQGSVIAVGSRVLSVFIQTTAGHDELWGASFECG